MHHITHEDSIHYMYRAVAVGGGSVTMLSNLNRTDSKVEHLKICPMVDGVVFHDEVGCFKIPTSFMSVSVVFTMGGHVSLPPPFIFYISKVSLT